MGENKELLNNSLKVKKSKGSMDRAFDLESPLNSRKI